MYSLLWVAAFVMAIIGVFNLAERRWWLGAIWLIGACLIGPGGYSIFV